MNDVIGRRCLKGCRTWPDLVIYSHCPRCDEPTIRYRGRQPISVEEAEKAAIYAAFERFYEAEWEQDEGEFTIEDLEEMGIHVKAVDHIDIDRTLLTLHPRRDGVR